MTYPCKGLISEHNQIDNTGMEEKISERES